jgi:hypothetical protein
MKDVYCYAGYFPQGNDLTPFAILLNQPQNNREQILHILQTAHRLATLSQINQ